MPLQQKWMEKDVRRRFKTGMGVADVLDYEKRALAQITGQGSLDDPDANFWAKPRQAFRITLKLIKELKIQNVSSRGRSRSWNRRSRIYTNRP